MYSTLRQLDNYVIHYTSPECAVNLVNSVFKSYLRNFNIKQNGNTIYGALVCIHYF